MRIRKILAFALSVIMLIAVPFAVSANSTPYGTLIGEHEISTYKPGGWGVGTMRICVYADNAYVVTDQNTTLAFPVFWYGDSGDYVYFDDQSDSGELSLSDHSMYDIASGRAVVDGKTLNEWKGEDGAIGISFDWSNNPNDRSFFELQVPTDIEEAVTGIMEENNRIRLNTPSLGEGTLWVRIYTPDTFSHILETETGTPIQYALSWKANDNENVYFGVSDNSTVDLYQVLRGEFEIEGRLANSYLTDETALMLCFDNNGIRRWFSYSIVAPTTGTATGELVNEVQMTLHFDQPTNLGEGTLWLRVMTDDVFDGLKRTSDGTPIQYPLAWTGAAGNDIHWRLADEVEAGLVDIISGNVLIGETKLKDLIEDDESLMLCFEDKNNKRTWYPITDTEINLPDFRIQRAVIVSDTQIVVEFTEDVNIEGAPFMALRVTDKAYNMIWDDGAPLQLPGGWHHSKTQANKLIWTLDTNNSFGIKTIAQAMEAFTDGQVVFCIEEKPDEKDGEDGTICNITNADGVMCYANKVGAGADYDGIYLVLETDLEYDLNPFTSDTIGWIVLPMVLSFICGSLLILRRKKYSK